MSIKRITLTLHIINLLSIVFPIGIVSIASADPPEEIYIIIVFIFLIITIILQLVKYWLIIIKNVKDPMNLYYTSRVLCNLAGIFLLLSAFFPFITGDRNIQNPDNAVSLALLFCSYLIYLLATLVSFYAKNKETIPLLDKMFLIGDVYKVSGTGLFQILNIIYVIGLIMIFFSWRIFKIYINDSYIFGLFILWFFLSFIVRKSTQSISSILANKYSKYFHNLHIAFLFFGFLFFALKWAFQNVMIFLSILMLITAVVISFFHTEKKSEYNTEILDDI